MQTDFETLQMVINKASEFLVEYSFNIVGAFAVLAIGFFVAAQVSRVLFRFFESKKFDITLSKFLSGMARMIILVFAVIIALGKFGITITPFVAALSAMAFGASFAIQGPLSNYGAGLSIILSRPFVVGDTITVQGVSGIVEDVKLASTLLLTADGVKITIPNKHIVGEILHNSGNNRIIDTSVGISYTDDPGKAIRLIHNALEGLPGLASDIPAQVGIHNFGESSIDIGIRVWARVAEYYPTLYGLHDRILKAFREGGVTIPFPQRDVHMVKDAA
ncbi:MAG: mechanosensitive ion channel [Candidatus Omnitrophica bacterium]|nr:mechanosensitive ion channel [Candidatus Omnitrophota bacterium]